MKEREAIVVGGSGDAGAGVANAQTTQAKPSHTTIVTKVFKPTSPGVRHKVVRKGVRQGPQEVPKSLRVGVRKTGGRNNTGRISAWHIGGGVPGLHRVVTRRPSWTQGVVEAIQVDPHRSAPLARIRVLSWDQSGVVGKVDAVDAGLGVSPDASGSSVSSSKQLAYRVAGKGMEVGTVVHCGMNAPFVPHARMPLRNIPMGTEVYDRERIAGKGAQLVKTAGASAERVRVDEEKDLVLVRLPSKKERWIGRDAWAALGRVGKEDHRLEVAGKAGITRRRGVRPTVRGVAMNPIDHPHGGRTSGGRHDVTPWAKIAKGRPTGTSVSRKTSMFVVVPKK